MSRYNNQYGTYYDPVGSQSQQPTGYTPQTSTTTASPFPSVATSSGYGSNYQNYGSNTYGSQQYSTGTAQPTNNSATHAAAALSSLSGQDYNQQSVHRNQYDNSQQWYPAGSNQNANTYSASNLALPSRSQSNNSPIYAGTQPASSSNFSYQNAPSTAGRYHQTQNQPQRYNSPLHAVQQQGHSKQTSRGSNHQPSPQMSQAVRNVQQSASRQQSASVEPSPTTVDPSQVYDNRAELERKARIEAERRRKYEAEQAAMKAEEERKAAEQRKVEEAREKTETEAETKKADQSKKNEQRRKAREEKKQSKSAATTLAQMASAGAGSSTTGLGDEEEEQMREMFKKMREFNSRNPAMLAKLWEEERKSHAGSSQSPQAEKATPKTAAQQKGAAATLTAGSKTTPAQQKKPTSPKVSKATPTTAERAQQVATTQQMRPVSGQATTSLWPPHKKGQLAEATAKWLMNLPQNTGKKVSPDTVLNVLNTNPSYVQLCEAIEGLGLRFERSALARELLKAVPDGMKAQPLAKPATPVQNGASAQARPPSQGSPVAANKAGRAYSSGTVNYEAPISLSDAAREVNSMDNSGFQRAPFFGGSPGQPQQSPFFGQSQSPFFGQSKTLANGSRPPSQSQALEPEVKPEFKPEEPLRPPADKEEAARKRTFGDLVDLTAQDSDDDEPPPKKVAQAPMGPPNSANAQQRPFLQQPTAFKQYMYNPNQSSMHPPRPSPGHMTVPSHIAGQPQSFPLQQQAPPQPQPHPKQKGPTAEQQQQARVKGRMLVEPIMRDRVARKSKYDSKTLARDVLLATGRHPDMRGLNSHLGIMQKLLGNHGGELDSEGRGNRSDLSTIRWDLIDPEASKIEEVKKDDGTPVKADEPAGEAQNAIPERVTFKSPKMKRSIPNGSTTTGFQDSGGATPTKKRGRPPKNRFSMPGTSSTLTNGGDLGETNAETTPRPASRSATPSSAPTTNNAMATAGNVGYASFQQVNADGTKKKGRPVGWKKSVHSREAQGLPSATLPSRKKEKEKVQGQPKLNEEGVQQPHYQVYKCEWAGCQAELHNLDTLKKHVVKLHGKAGDDGEYECWWAGCAKGKPAEFKHIESWVKHVDESHLQPVAWRLGDGPKGGVASDTFHDTERASYLSDSYGRSVTPIISPPAKTSTPATDQSGSAPAMPAVKRVGRPPKDGVSKAERDISAPLKVLEEHKRIVGPTMDRMGCVLADDERRNGFLDDEDFEDEVYGSEHDMEDAA